MRSRIIMAACSLALFCNAVSAVQWVDDVRLTAGSGVSPSSVSEDFSGRGSVGADPDGTYEYDRLRRSAAFQVSLGYYGGTIFRYNGGFVWGAGLQCLGASYRAPLATDNHSVELINVGPFGQAGWGYAFSYACHMEATGFISAGYAHGGWVDDQTPTTVRHGDGGYFQGGVRLGVFWRMARHLVLGIQGELSGMESDIRVTNPSGSRSDLAIYSDGGALQGVIGVQF